MVECLGFRVELPGMEGLRQRGSGVVRVRGLRFRVGSFGSIDEYVGLRIKLSGLEGFRRRGAGGVSVVPAPGTPNS